MSAPTLWEEGQWSGRRVTRFSMLIAVVLVTADLVATGRLERIFDSGFVVLCVGMALAIRPRDFFRVGVLPPMLLLGTCVVLALGHRTAIAGSDDGLVQSVISGLAHHSGPLLAGYALALLVLGVRARVARRRTRPHSNRVGSPAPYLLISGNPEVKSTTVVGSEPASPSMTASST
ncbi:MAG: hypothetical protein JF565_13670 [Propionibacteriales bacterium]|nr:hypothetical protein [Propionibacteriales bacterium]